MMRHLSLLGRGALRLLRRASPPMMTPIIVEAPRLIKPLFMTTGYYLHFSYQTRFRCAQVLAQEASQSSVQDIRN